MAYFVVGGLLFRPVRPGQVLERRLAGAQRVGAVELAQLGDFLKNVLVPWESEYDTPGIDDSELENRILLSMRG